MRRIDFETHFYSRDFYDYLWSRNETPFYAKDAKTGWPRIHYTSALSVRHGERLVNNNLDLGAGRIEQMDAAGIDLQIISLSEPSVELFEPAIGSGLARSSNDCLAEAIRQYPTRFRGFAAIAPQDVPAGVSELERTMQQLGFRGWLTHANFGQGRYLDQKVYWPLLEAAEALHAPIYIHPSFPAITELHTYGFALAGAPFGFQFETAMVFMRLVLAGVFDQFPNLQIILGHLGETLPFLIERLDFPFIRPWFDPDDRPKLARWPSEVLRQNVFVTTSGRYNKAAFDCTAAVLGVDHILLGSDHPYETMADCIQFIESLGLSDEERAQIYHRNAQKLGID